MKIKEILKSNRSHLSDSSINTYHSNIKRLLKSTEKEYETMKDVEKNFDIIFDKLMEYPFNIRKTKMSAFIVLLDEKDNSKQRVAMLERLRDQLFEDANQYNKKEENQELSETKKKNFIPWKDVLKTHKRLETLSKPLWKLDKITKRDFNTLTEYVLLSCYVLIPPRRAKDYADFKIRNINEDKDNYMFSTKENRKSKSFFVFNSYKNAGRLGTQKIPIPNRLKTIIKKWANIQESDYLISTFTGKKISQVKINQIINRIFNKNIGPSLLRSIYLTEQYSKVNLKKLKETTENMGNSEIERTLKYVQKDKETDEE
jgi:hypothetical protein